MNQNNNKLDGGLIEGQQPKRLQGRHAAVGASSGMSVMGMVLFGVPFVGVGVWVMLVGLEVVPVDPDQVNAPMWVLTVFGLVFLAAGLMLWSMGWKQHRREQRRSNSALQHPNEPAMQDYPWDQTGYSPQRWQQVVKGVGMAVFMTVFLSMFNWWAFWSGSDELILKIIVSIFNLALIMVWFKAGQSMLHALKFGKTRLEFAQFPYYTGDWFQVKVQLPKGLERVESVQLTFRCVREFYETRGHGKNRSNHLVHEQLWAEEQQLSGAEIGSWPRFLKTTFVIPASAPGSVLAASQPLFWELELQAAVPGLDLKQCYLAPVYALQ